MANVLVVDDEPRVRELLSQKLEEWGYDVVPTCDGVEALERTESEEFDLVLSDWEMPRMTGIELCETLKGSEGTQDIPVIIIGADISDHSEAEAHDAGAVDYLTKPFSLTDLQARLSKALLR